MKKLLALVAVMLVLGTVAGCSCHTTPAYKGEG